MGDTGPIAWVLAHHWRAAGEPRRAVPHLLAAAAVAERGWATREVVDLYSLAAELADDERGARLDPAPTRDRAQGARRGSRGGGGARRRWSPSLDGTERLDGLLYAGRAEVWCERHEEALATRSRRSRTRRSSATRTGAPPRSGSSSDALAMRGDAGDLDRALALGDEALAAWRTGVRGYEHADHLHLQSDVKYWTGDYAGSARCASRGREVAGDVRSAHQLLRGGGMDAMASVGLGQHEVALEKLAAMMEIARELGTASAYLPNYQSVVFREVFDLDAARAASETALDASRDLEFRMPWRFALADLLQTALLEGDVGRAAADWPELWEDASTATGWTRWLIRGRLAVARAEIAALAGTARGGGRVGCDRRRAHAPDPACEVRGAGAVAARPCAHPARPPRRGDRRAPSRGRHRRPPRQPRRALARARGPSGRARRGGGRGRGGVRDARGA